MWWVRREGKHFGEPEGKRKGSCGFKTGGGGRVQVAEMRSVELEDAGYFLRGGQHSLGWR